MDESDDPWVVETPDGRFGYVDIPPTEGAVYYGAPLTRSQIAKIWRERYADTWFAFTGKSATPAEIANTLRSGVGVYRLGEQLATRPEFHDSPLYKRCAPGLIGYARSVMGDDWVVADELIAKAIAQNWDQETFHTFLVLSDDYVKSPEYEARMRQFLEAVDEDQP